MRKYLCSSGRQWLRVIAPGREHINTLSAIITVNLNEQSTGVARHEMLPRIVTRHHYHHIVARPRESCAWAMGVRPCALPERSHTSPHKKRSVEAFVSYSKAPPALRSSCKGAELCALEPV